MINLKTEILLVEDNPGDVRLTQEAFKNSSFKVNINIVNDGAKAIEYLYKKGVYTDSPTPELILLDLNLPRKNGKEVLEIIKTDDKLKKIPIVVLTTSQSEDDINSAYNLHANCYITKPMDFDDFSEVIHSIENFWLSTTQLPIV